MIAPDLDLELPDELGAVHFTGIGGSGMSGIARLFLLAGHRVTGSDLRRSDAVDALRTLGAEVAIGHDAAHVPPDAGALVVTGALWADNPEYLAALERGIPVLHRANALHWLTRGHRIVSIAGAHGKSTTTGMIVTALRGLGADPGFVNGGVVAGLGASADHGYDDEWIIEADESDGSFLLYDTAIAVITNVDDDHLDHYGTADAVEDAFVRFAGSAREAVVASVDDPRTRAVLSRVSGPRILTFGRADDADVRIEDLRGDADGVDVRVVVAGTDVEFRIAVPGEHNGTNAAGALAVLVALGHDPVAAARALEGFRGTGRRFELHGDVRGVRVYDDYAHHPAEVEVTLRTARTVVGDGRVIAVHQPHLYSRTRAMAGEFARAYEELADHTVVLGVFGAREDPIPGVTGALVTERFTDPSHGVYLPDWQEAADHVAGIAREGDLVVTLSCGDVYRIIPQLLASLDAIRPAPQETRG